MKTTLELLAENAQDYGWLTDVLEGGETHVLARLPDTSTWRDVARHCSRFAGGQWLFFPQGVFWNMTGSRGWIVDWGSEYRIERARKICKEVTGVMPSYSVGASARGMLRFVAPPDKYHKHASVAFKGAGVGYAEAKPGVYEHMAYFDLKSAYFQLTSRIPSLHWSISPSGNFDYQEMNPCQKSKWKDVLQAIASYKGLRNALWGSMVGAMHRSEFFCKGLSEWRDPWQGEYQGAGNLVARMAWELTLAAAYDTNAVYAQTDCVICPGDKRPLTWENFGFEYTVKARGKCEVIRQHNYRIGNKKTADYRKGYRFREENERKPIPDRWYCNEFLAHTSPIEINW